MTTPGRVTRHTTTPRMDDETMNKNQFQSDPRDFALEMVEQGLVSADHLLMCALEYMSCDDVRDMLDCNELSPRFDEDDEDESEPEDGDDEDAE